MQHIFRIALALLSCSEAAHATIYQCGSTFQGHPCAGAIVRSGSPTTDDDQSGARYAQMRTQMKAEHMRAEKRREAATQANTPAENLKQELHVIDRNAAKQGRKLGGGWNSGVPNMAAYAPLVRANSQ